jgi:RimJ/RimL family protein N-acetyltransferase
MHKIEQEDYERVRPILGELADVHLNPIAVLDGSCPGEVYVDDVAFPKTVYLISGVAHYLAGATDNDAFNAAFNSLLPRDRLFVLFCNLEAWGGTLKAVLRDTYAVQATSRYYSLKQIRLPDWQARIPHGFAMRRVDAELLAEDLENDDDVVDSFLGTWHSPDAFLAQGFGFCLVHNAEIVSWSLADYVHKNRCEIGIQTVGGYRRQGLGTLTAAATAAYAVAEGFSTVGWHCWANNVGSIGVAENVGFQRVADYGVFINHWPAMNVTDMTQEEFRAFAQSYERQFETRPPTSGFPHIVAAKAWALGRDRQRCFRHLNDAVDLGWLRSADHLRKIWPEFFWNPDLDQLEEWQHLVKRFETNGALSTAEKGLFG